MQPQDSVEVSVSAYLLTCHWDVVAPLLFHLCIHESILIDAPVARFAYSGPPRSQKSMICDEPERINRSALKNTFFTIFLPPCNNRHPSSCPEVLRELTRPKERRRS